MHGLDPDRDSGFDHRAMTSHMEAIAILIKSGRYLGYLPVHFARSFVEQGEMKSLLDDKLAFFDTFHLAHRKDEKNRAATLLSLSAGGVGKGRTCTLILKSTGRLRSKSHGDFRTGKGNGQWILRSLKLIGLAPPPGVSFCLSTTQG